MAKAMRKVRVGSVVSTRMDKTAVVDVSWRQRHLLYGKQVGRVSRFYVHDQDSQCQVGDLVRIEETRPISKTKRWRLMEILQRHQLPDIRPIELETDVEMGATGSEPTGETPLNEKATPGREEEPEA